MMSWRAGLQLCVTLVTVSRAKYGLPNWRSTLGDLPPIKLLFEAESGTRARGAPRRAGAAARRIARGPLRHGTERREFRQIIEGVQRAVADRRWHRGIAPGPRRAGGRRGDGRSGWRP